MLNPIICPALYLFCIQNGTHALFPFFFITFNQVASSLNSSYCYILHSGSTVFTWAGNLTSADDHELVERQLDIIKVRYLILRMLLLRTWFRIDRTVWLNGILWITLDSVVFNLGLYVSIHVYVYWLELLVFLWLMIPFW